MRREMKTSIDGLLLVDQEEGPETVVIKKTVIANIETYKLDEEKSLQIIEEYIKSHLASSYNADRITVVTDHIHGEFAGFRIQVSHFRPDPAERDE